jgi:Cytochrome c554 and c-prime
MKSRIRAVSWFALSAATVVIASCALDPYRDLTAIDHSAHAPRAADCGACHVEIYREFVASRHARSWDAPAFVAATAGHSFENCLGCHAPDSIFVAEALAVRPLHREEGVTCVACHFDGAALAGPAPRSSLLEPHPTTVEHPLYRSAELCGKCHEGTYREWLAAPRADDGAQRSCQECHMKPVTRKLTQGTDAISNLLVAYEDEFAGRAHSFQVDSIADLDTAFDFALTVRPEPTGGVLATLTITSRVPHLVPTGDFGFRGIRLEFAARDATGAVTESVAIDLFKELRTALRPGEPRDLELRLAAARPRFMVSLRSKHTGGEDAVLLEREITP